MQIRSGIYFLLFYTSTYIMRPMTDPRISPMTDPTAPVDDRPGVCNPARPAAQQITGCRWIDGDVQTPAWRYCQAPRLPGRSYCEAHHIRSINPEGDRQFTAELAECDLYLCDLPPPEDELGDNLDDKLDQKLDQKFDGA